jgi:CubicO group peptidase (beta-lactamase class C family)
MGRMMVLRYLGLLVFLLAGDSAGSRAQEQPGTPYYPDANWQHKAPEEVGLNPQRLTDAIDFAIASETKAPRDLVMEHYETFGREPFDEAIGPIKQRGDPTGLIIRHGFIVAEWGDPLRVDMAHSVTKSFLSSVVGIAVDRGIIRTIGDTVRDYVGPVQPYNPLPPSDAVSSPGLLALFDTPHNRLITWDNLLRQTSDWEGTLWGKPDWADRPGSDSAAWTNRVRNKPGTTYKYNDTRVNVLALAALNVWRRPLPQVLKENIMDPIGASNTWRWFGYQNSWIVLDGSPIQSVSGGGHYGGGMFINSYDMGRFGYLTLHHGKWHDRQLLSNQWIDWALTPTNPEPTYGFMNWFLNTDRKLWPSAPASAFAHIGNGTNMIYVDPDHDLIAVVRWIDGRAIDNFLKRLLAAIDLQ